MARDHKNGEFEHGFVIGFSPCYDDTPAPEHLLEKRIFGGEPVTCKSKEEIDTFIMENEILLNIIVNQKTFNSTKYMEEAIVEERHSILELC